MKIATMATMNISLPPPLRQWVKTCVDSGSYANASDYVRDLIRRDKERRLRLIAFQKAVDEGLASGLSEKPLDVLLEELRQEASDSSS